MTAFELDPSVVGGVDAHPFTFGGFPGRWQVGRPTLPSALGLTVARMRELVNEFNLPLVEVQVAEKDAYSDFPADPQKIESGPQTVTPPQTQAPLLDVGGELVPGPVPAGPHPELQPFAAEMIAADTKKLYPDQTGDEILADMPLEPDSESEQAAAEATGEPDATTDDGETG